MNERPITFTDAERQGAYALATQWVDTSLPLLPEERAAGDELAELATMSALRSWLERWQPIHIHRALLLGASVAQVQAALGAADAEAVRQRWETWAQRQRALYESAAEQGHPSIGVSHAEYDRVAAVFGLTEHGKDWS